MLAIFISHFVEFYFTGVGHEPWYHAAVWGNVVAVIPLAILGFIGYLIHKWITKEHEGFDSKTAHDERAKEARKLFDLLDPHTDGGIKEIHEHVEHIEDQVNEKTPGGLGTVFAEVRKLTADHEHGSSPRDESD